MDVQPNLMEILCFLAGTVFAFTWSLYPLAFVIAALFLKADWRIILWFLAAILFAGIHQTSTSERGMPNEGLIAKAELLIRISALPVVQGSKVQMDTELIELNGKKAKAHIMMSCYDHCPTFAPGELWRMQAKLKRPMNLGNPGHFDYRRALLARHITWTGYLKKGTARKVQQAGKNGQLLSLRASLAERVMQAVPDQEVAGIVEALTLGITNHISPAQWDLFRRTGTTHLMVISGAHISLVAGFAFGLVYWLWLRSSRLSLFRPASQAAAWAAMVTALVYALLAGFSVPAQRALVALCLFMLRHFMGQKLTGWQAWRYALLLVLLIEPHAVLLSGFYLSFLAVAILISSAKNLSCIGIKKNMALQLACLFGLMPLTLYFFSYGSVNSFIANLLAIPLVGYVIVPLSLLALLLVSASSITLIFEPCKWAVRGLFWYLHAVDRLSLLNIDWIAVNVPSLLALMLSGFILFFMRIRALIPVAAVLLTTALLPSSPRPAEGDAQVSVLDVGQGLSVVIYTANHTMIYDTGMAFFQGGDMAKMAIIPYLNASGARRIDKIIISHPDLDHRGGLTSLERRYPEAELIVDKPDYYHHGKACHTFPAWSWEGVHFRFLPIKEAFRDKNNSSCVLQITNGAGTVLLTGDIESKAEQYLTHTLTTDLRADVLLVAHHGSKTSSTPNFIRAVSPRFAIISAGFDNRYHFPHQQTLTTLQRQGAKIYNTLSCGMVTIRMRAGLPLQEPDCYSTV